MKKSFLLLIAFWIVSVTAQNRDYAALMENPNASFSDIQQAFQLNWQGKDRTIKGKGYKAFKRWEYIHQRRLMSNGSLQNNHALNYAAYKNYFGSTSAQNAQRNLSVSAQASGTWTYIGPTNGISSGGGAGRATFIRFDPLNTSIMYTGSPAGGLWKSINGGTSWFPLADELASIGCSDLLIDYTNTNVLYLATGDTDGKDTYSIGVLKSTDGGVTWSATGLIYGVNQSYTIAKMLMDPINPQIIYAATSTGLMKTTDGGVNWLMIKNTGFKDIEFKPFNSNTIYASNNASFWFSKDAGVTWDATPTNFAGSVGRSCIAVTPADSNYIYMLGAKGASGSADDYGFEGIVRSTDGGQSFTLMCSSPNILGWSTSGNDQGGQGWYDLALACSPTNKNTIVTGGVNLWKSTNGGATMTNCSNWFGSGSGYAHADQHAIEFFPGSGTTVLVANDGGVFKSTNTGSGWTDISNGLCIAQQYNLGVSQTTPAITLTGWQDNGTNLHNGTACGEVLGGDGFECIVSWSNSSTMYGELYYGDISKSTNGGGSWSNIVSSGGTGVDEDGAWNTPYIQHPTNAGTLLVGKTQVYRTTNSGTSWTQVGNLTQNGMISEMAYAPSNPNYIYVTDGGGLWVSTNGISFTNKTAQLPVMSITGITVDPSNPSVVYFSSGGLTATNKVFVTRDAGNTWNNYSAGLPNIQCNEIVFQPNTYDALYLATDIGVFYRDSTMSQWMAYSNGLPNVIVSELEIQESTGKLRAATYGRGLWETDLYVAPTSAPVASFTSNLTEACINAPVDFSDVSSNLPYAWSWTFGGGNPSTSSVQFPTVTWTNAGTYPVKLVVSNSVGTDSVVQNSYIVIYPLPLANAGPDVTICKGDTIQLQAGGGVAYQWGMNTTMNNLFVFNPLAFPPQTKNYSVTVRDTNGCKANDYITVNVIQPFANPSITANGNQLTANPSGASLFYQWFYNGLPIAGATAQAITADSSGLYTVQVSDTSGCFILNSPAFIFVGLKDISYPGNLAVFPNPSDGNINFQWKGNQEREINFKMYSLDGKLVFSQLKKIKSGEIFSVYTELPSGLYQLMAEDVFTSEMLYSGKSAVIR